MGFFNLGSDSKVTVIEACYTGSSVPGKTIEKYIGLVEFVKKGVGGDVTKSSEGIFQCLVDAAKQHGANAVINARVATGSYEQQGSKWNTTYIIAYGDAVILS